jgi:glucose/arabinose dehydrogenase
VWTPAQGPGAVVGVQSVADGLHRPVALTHAGDGSRRLFITLQEGTVVIHGERGVQPTAFLDIRSLVLCCGEQGLFSVAFHPGYGVPGGAGRGTFFVNYTRRPDGATVIARYRVSTTDPDRADPTSARVLLTIAQPFSNHNGGQLQFGPDGYLYVGMGDGGGGGDPDNRAQNLGDLLGKMLRIDVDGAAPYAIPPTNPFVGTPGARPEIWAFGFRNPWRFSFDRLTGDLFIGDVGQNTREEIDFQSASSPGGENYGWHVMEGSACYPPGATCDRAGLVLPILDYAHPTGCSVTGGYRYRGAGIASLYGRYVFSDFCAGVIWTAAPDPGGRWTSDVLLETPFQISALGEDEAGELYVLHRPEDTSGAVYRLIAPRSRSRALPAPDGRTSRAFGLLPPPAPP